MTEYQRIEYRIGSDGKVTERVLNGRDDRCVVSTNELETALGEVEQREYLPEYRESENAVTATVSQSQPS
jgi:hypothetical protein